MIETDCDKITVDYEKVKNSFNQGKTEPIEYRLEQIKSLVRLLEENEEEILEAMGKDGRCKEEALITDFIVVKKEGLSFVNNLSTWLNECSYFLSSLFVMSLDSVSCVREPLGVVLVIGTWNYAISSSFMPLFGAIAGGNTALLKLSEVSEKTSDCLSKLIPKYLDQDCFRVVTGGIPQSTKLLSLKWDHVFFTGNSSVGKIVAKAAAENLTTCTLELGGKSPCIIDRGVNLELAAKRIAYGKYLNCGQTCIAPDYLLIPSDMKEEFVESLKKAIVKMFGEFDSQEEWISYGKIVSKKHYNRLVSYLEKTKGKILLEGKKNEAKMFFGPTIVDGGDEKEPLHNEEIFGPILLILECDSVSDAINYVKTRKEKPLACYLFSNNSESIQRVKRSISSGGTVINDCVIHYAINTLPFGGVGASGMGRAHGKYSLQAFTHEKPVLHRTNISDIGNYVRYPPYTETKTKILSMAL